MRFEKNLSARELAVATRYARGLTYIEISKELFIAPATVRNHLTSIYRKLGINNKAELASLLTADDDVRAAAERTAASAQPSLAILPFVNLSGDPRQEYFSDGITEDIITQTSRFPGLRVTARASVYDFKSSRSWTRGNSSATGGQIHSGRGDS